MHADLAQLVLGVAVEGDGPTGGVGKGRAIVGQTGVVDVVVGQIGPINSLRTATASGYEGQAKGQHDGQQRTETHGGETGLAGKTSGMG